MNAAVIVVMGVSGCGKSTVGEMLARALSLEFLEGDSLHSAHNVARMASGVALTDQDRQAWLVQISERLTQVAHSPRGVVVSCSALKRAYRDVLRRGASDLILVHLTGSRELLAARTAHRSHHYMPASLLDSQLATLEPPHADEGALTFDVAPPAQTIVRSIQDALALRIPSSQ